MRMQAILACAILIGLMTVASATSIFVQGTITAVNKDFKGFTVKGYDHYNAKRYNEKITDIPVKFAANCVCVLDTRILAPAQVLAVGRKAYAIGSSAGAMIVVALSEPADREIGEVVSAADGKLKLKVTMGADSMEVELALDKDTAAPEAGALIRVLPARKQTVLAYTDKAFEKSIPDNTPFAASGVLKTFGDALSLSTIKDGAVADAKPEGKKVPTLADVRGFPGHDAPDTTGIGPGSPAMCIGYWKRPGTANYWLVLQAPDAGRTDGLVKAYDAAKHALTVSVLKADKLEDVTITLDADAAVKVDGKDATTDALKAGMPVSVFAARKQTIAPMAKPAAPAH